MSKHTSGPWFVRENYTAVLILRSAKRSGMSDHVATAHEIVHPCLTDKEIQATQLANALLMAAAPELLEAAKEIVAATQTVGDGEPEWGRLWKARNDLVAAITKAEGNPNAK